MMWNFAMVTEKILPYYSVYRTDCKVAKEQRLSKNFIIHYHIEYKCIRKKISAILSYYK